MKQRKQNAAQQPSRQPPTEPSLLETTAIPREALRKAAQERAEREAKAAQELAARREALYRQEEGTELERRLRRDRIFFNNPVIMQGLGLAPLIVADTTVKNAWMLTVAVLLLLMPTRVLASLIARAAPYRFRGFAYALSAGIVYIGVYWVMSKLFIAADLALLGLYLPLLVVDPIILKRYERAQNEQPGTAMSKGIVTALGYAAVLLVVGCTRELLGFGTLHGVQILPFSPLPLARLPVGGFGVLAILMVLWRSVSGVMRAALLEEQEESHE